MAKISNKEPQEAFPYTPPSEAIKHEFSHIFDIDSPLPNRALKNVFDKILSLILILILNSLKMNSLILSKLILGTEGSL